jgi:hypothetical protein
MARMTTAAAPMPRPALLAVLRPSEEYAEAEAGVCDAEVEDVLELEPGAVAVAVTGKSEVVKSFLPEKKLAGPASNT